MGLQCVVLVMGCTCEHNTPARHRVVCVALSAIDTRLQHRAAPATEAPNQRYTKGSDTENA